MTRSYSFPLALATLFCAGTALAADHTIEIKNTSDWSIAQLFLSPTKQQDWGADQFGKHVVNTGESFKLSGVPPGKYDVKIVDEDGDECVVSDVKIAESEVVTIDNQSLVGCQAATEAESEDEESEE